MWEHQQFCQGLSSTLRRVLLESSLLLPPFREIANVLIEKDIWYSDFRNSPTYMSLAFSIDETRSWNARYLDYIMHLYVRLNNWWLESESKQNINGLNFDKHAWKLNHSTLSFPKICNKAIYVHAYHILYEILECLWLKLRRTMEKCK